MSLLVYRSSFPLHLNLSHVLSLAARPIVFYYYSPSVFLPQHLPCLACWCILLDLSNYPISITNVYQHSFYFLVRDCLQWLYLNYCVKGPKWFFDWGLIFLHVHFWRLVIIILPFYFTDLAIYQSGFRFRDYFNACLHFDFYFVGHLTIQDCRRCWKNSKSLCLALVTAGVIVILRLMASASTGCAYLVWWVNSPMFETLNYYFVNQERKWMISWLVWMLQSTQTCYY